MVMGVIPCCLCCRPSWYCIKLLSTEDCLQRKYFIKCIEWVFSSPEPKAPGGAYSIGRLRLSVRPSTISNDFSETTGPIATKFHIQPPGTLGKKNCSNGLGHMTNMAAMPIYGKNLKNLLYQNQ